MKNITIKIKKLYIHVSDFIKKNMSSIKLFGKIFSFLAIIYVIYTLYKIIQKIDYKIFDKNLYIFLIVSIIISICNIIAYAYSYMLLLRKTSKKKIAFNNIIDIYLISNIYKYLPSNVMHYFGRNTIAYKYHIEQKNVIKATIYEIINVILVTMVFSSLCYFIQNRLYFVLPIILFITIGIIYSIGLTKSFIIIFCTTIINNLIIVIIYNLLNQTSYLNEYYSISIYQSISWLAGFLTPGSPGGLGVKEYVLIKLGSGKFTDLLPVVAVIHRIVLILSDLLSFTLIIIKQKIFSKIAEKGDVDE